jgi:hypothetical protein
MIYRLTDIGVQVNFACWLRHRDTHKIDRKSLRRVHNVFTNIGRSWIAKLTGFYSLGDPDRPLTNTRVRWMGMGTGLTQLETVTVEAIETPTLVDDSYYLKAVNPAEMLTTENPTIRFSCNFGPAELSTNSNPLVALTEAALFVDCYRVSSIGGEDDSAHPGLETTLDPTDGANPPVSYARFEVINKSQDFELEVRWDWRFGAPT